MDTIDGTTNGARRLAQVLLTEHDEMKHATCLDALEPYIEAQLAGRDYMGLFPIVAQHLDSCISCAESYALVYKTQLAPQAVPVPAVIPQWDLSFLPAPTPVPQLSPAARLREALRAAIEATGSRVRVTLNQALLDLLPPPAPALALRSGTPTEWVVFDMELEEPGTVIAGLRLTAYQTPKQVEQAMVRVQLALQDRDWPDLADVPVLLRLGDVERRALTDPWGEVLFPDVALVNLREFQVEVDTGMVPPINV